MNDRLSQVAGLDSLKVFGNCLFIETDFLGYSFDIGSSCWTWPFGQVAGLDRLSELIKIKIFSFHFAD